MLGYDRYDVAGVLLSAESLNEVNKDIESYSKTNRAQQRLRQSRVPRRKNARK
jgi:hypothetical protein